MPEKPESRDEKIQAAVDDLLRRALDGEPMFPAVTNPDDEAGIADPLWSRFLAEHPTKKKEEKE
jgi:hypothetical protein